MLSRRNACAVISLAATTMLGQFASAQQVNGFVDWKGNLEAGNRARIDTHIARWGDPWHPWDDPDGTLSYYMRDSVTLQSLVSFDADTGGFAFFDNNAQQKSVVITTVYGMDLTPFEPGVMLTGVDPSDPQFVPASVETVFGRSGASYESGPHIEVRLADLAGLLPDHDLSWFALGDPNSMLYAFQTEAPLDDFYVPGPSPLALLCVGGCVAANRRRNRIA